MDNELNFNQIKRIGELDLPSLERHHLRLLAHCLESFKTMHKDSEAVFPTKDEQLHWCLDNPLIKEDKDFISLLLDQFAIAELQLKEIAKNLKRSPMELTLDDLITHAFNQTKK